MYDNRKPLKEGSVLSYNLINIYITDVLGMGGNAIVYLAEYKDSVLKSGMHKCVIKELYPYDADCRIYRDKSDRIIVDDNARDLFEIHKKSFVYGNSIHINILNENPDSLGMNYDSFECNNTIYTILSLNSIFNLREKIYEYNTLEKTAIFTIKLLKAVDVFHKNNILHLDISPDNIIISSSNGEDRALIIDFNSSYIMGGEYKYLNINSDFSAPELKLKEFDEPTAAADLYSVSAVMLYILTGKTFKNSKANIKALLNIPQLKYISQPAVYYFLHIVTKAMRLNPKLRYRNTDEMLSDLNELINRINNRGITHGSLWEISRNICDYDSEEILENNIINNDKIFSSNSLYLMSNTVLTGEGGIGKTTLLKKLWYDNTRVYNSKKPVFWFVPLYRYDGKADFIKRYIVSKINFNKDISTIDDAIKRLNDFMREDVGIYIMLDGFNEISHNASELIKEIEDISRMPKVAIAISSRNGISVDGFTSSILMPLEDSVVIEYLNKNGLAYPSEEKLKELLKNPLMLKLYSKSENVYKNSSEFTGALSTRSEIIHSYILSFVRSLKNTAPYNKSEIIRLEYILEILFPYICRECKKYGGISYEKIMSVCEKDHKRLNSKAFNKAYSKYSGRTMEILNNVSTPEEWFNKAVNDVLINDTALIINDNGLYYPIHMSFAECLEKDFIKNNKKYHKAALGIKIPIAAALILISISAFSVIYYFTPGTHPIGKKEITYNNSLMSGVQQAAYNITTMTQGEERVIKAIKNGDRKAALQAVNAALAELGDEKHYKINVNISDYSYYGLDTYSLEKLYKMSEEHYIWLSDLYERLKYALDENSRYNDSYIKNAVEDLEEYADTLKKIQVYRICLLEKSVNKRGREPLERLKNTDTYFMEYSAEAASLSYDELYELIDGERGLEKKLNNINNRLDIIKGKNIDAGKETNG